MVELVVVVVVLNQVRSTRECNTGNEFRLCHWKAGTEREGQVVAVVEFNTGNFFFLFFVFGKRER